MEEFDIDNVQSINYQKRDIEGICTPVLSYSDVNTQSLTSDSYVSTEKSSEITSIVAEKIDSIKSCESILKVPHTFNYYFVSVVYFRYFPSSQEASTSATRSAQTSGN